MIRNFSFVVFISALFFLFSNAASVTTINPARAFCQRLDKGKHYRHGSLTGDYRLRVMLMPADAGRKNAIAAYSVRMSVN